jgi:CubicO group peptidase (beta-lactamase class C family)
MRDVRSISLPIAFCLCAVAARAAAPDALPRATPESQGIASSAILQFVEDADKTLDALHSIVIVRHGRVIAEGWWAPYAADEPHMMFSLSKSFTSTAIGLAVADGKLSLDDTVLSFFPDDAPADPSANLKAMRVRDLLTMTAGHHEEDIRDFPFTADENLVNRFLALPVAHKPGTLFVYNTPASYILSAIVQKVTGQTVLDYLRPRLFDPLGIRNPTWEASKQGISMGGFGLNVRTEDIARFGLLYLQNGKWQGKQIVPADWVATATARHVSNGSSPTSDWEQGYGYQFWRSRHGFYRGDGAHGQFCLVLPQFDVVIAMTSGTRDMAAVMNLVWDRLLPAFKSAALPADAESNRRLVDRLATLSLPALRSTTAVTPAKTVLGKRYLFPTNPQSIEAITLVSTDDAGAATFSVRSAGMDLELVVGGGVWHKGLFRTTDRYAATSEHIAASGGWTANDTYALKVVRYNTPFVTTYQLRFAGDQLIVDSEQNVGPANERVRHVEGTLEKVPSNE